MGGHASPVGEYKSELADVVSPASSPVPEPGGLHLWGVHLEVVDQGLIFRSRQEMEKLAIP